MSLHKADVLLVDDDIQILDALSYSLAEFGYRIRKARDGFEALDAMRQEVPDILLSDLQMPGMSGFELLSVVRRRFPAVRVIAMSAAYVGTAVPAGVAAHAFHPKATNPRALFECIAGMAEMKKDAMVQAPAPVNLIWIARNIHDCSGTAYVLLACPDCLRTFPELLALEGVIHETVCAYCDVSMRYAVVPPFEVALALPLALGLGWGAKDRRDAQLREN